MRGVASEFRLLFAYSALVLQSSMRRRMGPAVQSKVCHLDLSLTNFEGKRGDRFRSSRSVETTSAIDPGIFDKAACTASNETLSSPPLLPVRVRPNPRRRLTDPPAGLQS